MKEERKKEQSENEGSKIKKTDACTKKSKKKEAERKQGKQQRQQGRTNANVEAEAASTAFAVLAAEPNLLVTGYEIACTECGLLTTCWCDGVTMGGRCSAMEWNTCGVWQGM